MNIFVKILKSFTEHKLKTITYNLNCENRIHSDYYPVVRAFTEEVMQKAQKDVYPLLNRYKQYIKSNELEPVRSDEEYLYDLLSLGVYWQCYANHAVTTSMLSTTILEKLYTFRRRFPKIKPLIDPVRGWLATLFLTSRPKPAYDTPPVNFKNVQRLVRWLSASGEFREEVTRYRLLMDFFVYKTESELVQDFYRIYDLASWFELAGLNELGKYTCGVDEFKLFQHASYRWKENYLFTGRSRVEYHLSMVGAELMNRAFRNKFEHTSQKALLVPACMRGKSAEACRAKKQGLDLLCSGCDQSCRVNYYRKMGQQKGYSVHIIPHSSDFSNWLKTFASGKNIGVIGVACPLNLITGGLELKKLEIPSQCVLLDYCGCKNHWDKQGIPTDFNETEFVNFISGTRAKHHPHQQPTESR